MQTEKGVVIKVANDRAWIKTEKTSTCESCSSRHACGNPGGGKEMEVEAINSAKASVGDLVLISFETGPLIKVYSLVYIFPIVALLAGAIIGQKLASFLFVDESLSALIAGTLFFIGAFFVVKSCSNKMAKKEIYQPKVLKILSAERHSPV